MNKRTSKILRRYVRATGAPLSFLKRKINETPAPDRGKALAAIEEATAQAEARAKNRH